MVVNQRTAVPNRGFTSPLRYPGGKGALSSYVKRLIDENGFHDRTYIECYAGGAGIAWSLLFEEYVRDVHINDVDKAIFSFWQAAIHETEELCARIWDTPVTMDEWRRQRSILLDPENQSNVDVGYSTFFLNRTNRSGIVGGGVIGGRGQSGKWKLDARYNKQSLINRICRIADYRDRIKLTNDDAAGIIQALSSEDPDGAFVYMDPPYYSRGGGLYRNEYGPKDHKLIALLVGQLKCPWIVSYDNAEKINEHYSRYEKITYDLNYRAQRRYKGHEVMFFSQGLRVPNVDDVLHP